MVTETSPVPIETPQLPTEISLITTEISQVPKASPARISDTSGPYRPFSRLFGKPKEKPSPSPTDTINKLQESLGLLQNREAHLTKKIEFEKKNASELLSNKNRKGN